MNCCVECFQDVQIRKIIATNNEIGNCDFCGQKNVGIYKVEASSDLAELIGDVINVYEKDVDGEPLFDVLINDWSIFNRTLPGVQNLVESFCNIILGECECGHNVNVKIPYNDIMNYGIFSGHSWGEFSEMIKTTNRFYHGYFKAGQFFSFLSYSITKYKEGKTFFRARVWDDGHRYNADEMGAPPFEKRKSGRVNPEGIGVLYLTSDEKTALSEVRASAFDFVSVGMFRLKKDIEVINISALNKISPALYEGGLESLAANIKIFSDIAREIAKPLRKNDSILEYLPTQYITEVIKSKKYEGVEFTSTMGTCGNNIAVFDESWFECISVHDVEIKKIEYEYENIN